MNKVSYALAKAISTYVATHNTKTHGYFLNLDEKEYRDLVAHIAATFIAENIHEDDRVFRTHIRNNTMHGGKPKWYGIGLTPGYEYT
jgi:hypothetical protein